MRVLSEGLPLMSPGGSSCLSANESYGHIAFEGGLDQPIDGKIVSNPDKFGCWKKPRQRRVFVVAVQCPQADAQTHQPLEDDEHQP